MTRGQVAGARYVYVRAPIDEDGAVAPLTRAEREIASLVVKGLSNASIARARAVSARTVANQLAAIYRKLRVGSRVELVALLVGADAQGR